MRKWIAKAMLQKVIASLPMSHEINAFFQKYVTKGLYASKGAFEAKLKNCRSHVEYFATYGHSPIEQANIFELGTGWWPIIPIGMYLHGAKAIWTYDIHSHLKPDTFMGIVDHFNEYIENRRLYDLLPSIKQDRVSRFMEWQKEFPYSSPVEAFEKLNIHVVVDDATQTSLPEATMDLVLSNACFEHIPVDIQLSLHKEFHRIAKKDAVFSHFIGIGDQHSNWDKSITIFNYLKYTQRQWRIFNNSIIPQTRLRASQYCNIIEDAGYAVVKKEPTFGSEEELNSVDLAPEFQIFSREDLLTVYLWIVAIKNSA